MTDFVLVHGAFHGGWCWEQLGKLLVAAGHRVHAPTLAGCAERADEPHAAISLKTHIDEVVALIEGHDLDDVVLVGHSLGGMVITAVADRCRDRIARLVYLDAFVPRSGEAARDLTPPAMQNATLQAVHVHGGGVSLPVVFPSSKFVRSQGQAVTDFMARLTPQPFLTFAEPVYLANPPVEHRTYIYCSGVPFGLFDGYAEAARNDPSWAFHDLPTAHDAMIEDPGAVAAILL
jgi:pimeloyl-ACP methyl ester carboxylesterase